MTMVCHEENFSGQEHVNKTGATRGECVGVQQRATERSECEATTDNRMAPEHSKHQSVHTQKDLRDPNRRQKDEEELGERS